MFVGMNDITRLRFTLYFKSSSEIRVASKRDDGGEDYGDYDNNGDDDDDDGDGDGDGDYGDHAQFFLSSMHSM